MDSNEINKFAQALEIEDFLGVFAVDELTLIPKNRTGLVIFNTDTSQNSGQHWIALCITKRNIYYFDSLFSEFQHSIYFKDYMKFAKKRLIWKFNMICQINVGFIVSYFAIQCVKKEIKLIMKDF